MAQKVVCLKWKYKFVVMTSKCLNICVVENVVLGMCITFGNFYACPIKSNMMLFPKLHFYYLQIKKTVLIFQKYCSYEFLS